MILDILELSETINRKINLVENCAINISFIFCQYQDQLGKIKLSSIRSRSTFAGIRANWTEESWLKEQLSYFNPTYILKYILLNVLSWLFYRLYEWKSKAQNLKKSLSIPSKPGSRLVCNDLLMLEMVSWDNLSLLCINIGTTWVVTIRASRGGLWTEQIYTDTISFFITWHKGGN